MQHEVLCDNVVEAAEALIRACHWHTSSLPLKAKMFALDQKKPTHAHTRAVFQNPQPLMQEDFRWLGRGGIFLFPMIRR